MPSTLEAKQRRFAELVRLFELCAESDPPEQAALLAAADQQLRLDVLRMLSVRAEAETFLDSLVHPPPDEAAESLPPGTRLGQYTLQRLVGEGGAGAVYEAQQDNPPRRVALKLITGLTRRFDDEVRALARMRHPGIVHIYDCGRFAASGPPVAYLAMELVEGEPITQFASSRRLGLAARLELLASVCDAVQHAHALGVIHRDLKPANILVDEVGRPKVLDFGLARLRESQRDASLTSGAGTPAYMSPEQAAGEELDTSTDVYSLGVIAYEVLVGRLPYATPPQSLLDAARIIGRSEPIRPSTLRPDLRGDTEAVLLKALRSDRRERYASADALAADLRHIARREPVAARPPTIAYLFASLARRHRTAVVGILGILLALLTGGAAAVWQAVRATHAEARAHARAQRLEQLAGSLIRFSDSVRMIGAPVEARDSILRDVLPALEAIRPDAADRGEMAVPLAEAYRAMGRHLGFPAGPNLGRAAEAADAYTRAIDLLGNDPANRARGVRVRTRLHVLRRSRLRAGARTHRTQRRDPKATRGGASRGLGRVAALRRGPVVPGALAPRARQAGRCGGGRERDRGLP